MNNPDQDPQLLTIAEVCDLLRIGQTRVYELLDEGVLPSVKIGALRRIPRPAVVELARQGLPQTANADAKGSA